MTTAATIYRIHAPIPEFLVREKDNLIEAKIYDEAGNLTGPASGTVTLYNASNTKIVDAAAVTITGDGVVQYTVAAASLPESESYGDGWRLEWELVFGADPAVMFVRAASLVRSNLFPTVIATDLEARHQNLSRLIATGNDADNFITAAWEVLLRMLLKAGRMPYLILSPFALHDALVFKSLELIFRDGHTAAGDGKFAELAEDYQHMFASEWASISFDYDSSQDGQADADEKAGAEAVIFTGGPGVQTGSLSRWP